jgi:phospholipid/cholesterol/gamma-HCH transport system substrate-binding protein
VVLGGAVVVVAMMLLGGGDSYKIKAEFQNASQLVNGNLVEVGGVKAGTVSDITIGDNGNAVVELSIDEDYKPLHEGIVAVIRQGSLSSIAGRHIELQMPEGDLEGAEIDDGETLPLSDTVSSVDLDELFNTFDDETINSFKRLIKGFAIAYDGIGPQTNRGVHYLNPFLSTSREVFGELTKDERTFERLLIDTASLSGSLAERAPDLQQFIANTDQLMGALASENENLVGTLDRLPDFMRNFDTTAVNIRAALDDLDPLVEASKPVAKRLIPFSAALRGFAIDAVPTIRDLDEVVLSPGADNDLVDLTALQPDLAEIAVGPVNRHGAERRGAFPESVDSLVDSLPSLSFFRPYISTEAVSGWFDDFGHSGIVDANGGMGRISTTFNAFIFSAPGVPNLLAPPLTPAEIATALRTDQLSKCPGANESPAPDGSNPFTDGGQLNCDPSQYAPAAP